MWVVGRVKPFRLEVPSSAVGTSVLAVAPRGTLFQSVRTVALPTRGDRRLPVHHIPRVQQGAPPDSRGMPGHVRN